VNANIFLFTGDNGHALRKELSRWRLTFEEKYGPENIEQLDGSKTSSNELTDSVATLPFLAEKRMVIVHQIPKSTKEQIQLLATNIHPDCVMLIVDAKPDKRTVAYKAVKEIATVKSFEPLSGTQLTAWVVQESARFSRVCSGAAAAYLMEMVGEDQDMLANELQKIVAFTQPDSTIETSVIDLLSMPSGQQVIWKLTDLLGRKDITSAISFMSKIPKLNQLKSKNILSHYLQHSLSKTEMKSQQELHLHKDIWIQKKY
jgi:DNA polymerase-3 subunit delta